MEAQTSEYFDAVFEDGVAEIGYECMKGEAEYRSVKEISPELYDKIKKARERRRRGGTLAGIAKLTEAA